MIGEGLLRCATGEDEFAIRAHDVRHVARADQLRSDETTDGRAGVVRLGGHLVPVFRLRSTLGLPPLDTAARHEQHIAVTGDHDELVGWLVDRISREPETSTAQIAALPAAIGGKARHWFEGVVTCADRRTILLLDPKRLDPLRPNTSPRDEDDQKPFVPQLTARIEQAEPVALVFSTPSLPDSRIDKFALSGRQVAAIVQPSDPIGVPGCAPHVAGLTLWRDVVVPIVDFRRGSRAGSSQQRRLIARCAVSHSLMALTIDADVVMHRPAADNKLVVDVPCPPFANGVFDLNGDKVALLDLDALVTGAG